MIFRVAITLPADGTLPEDAMQITPHYFGDDAQALVDRLKANLVASSQVGAAKPFTIKAYNAEAPPPSYPLATASQAGTPPNSTIGPREIALCLSYYSTWNRPRYRGRLYIPHLFIGGQCGARPTTQQMTDCMKWKDALTNGLPSAHNMVVYSRKNGEAYGVTDFWVDDEWDVIRSRGRKPTARQTATYP